MITVFNKLLNPIRRKLANIVARCVVTLVDDSLKLQGLQLKVLAGETLDRVERFQEYGFTSVPLAGAEAVLLSIGGYRSHPIVIAVDHRGVRKKNMQPGEVALYTDEGDEIYFKRGQVIEITSGAKVKVTAQEIEATASTKATVTSPLVNVVATTKVYFDTPLVECENQLLVKGAITGQGGMAISGGSGAQVTGNINVTSGDVTADGIGLKPHTHQENDAGGQTGPAQ